MPSLIQQSPSSCAADSRSFGDVWMNGDVEKKGTRFDSRKVRWGQLAIYAFLLAFLPLSLLGSSIHLLAGNSGMVNVCCGFSEEFDHYDLIQRGIFSKREIQSLIQSDLEQHEKETPSDLQRPLNSVQKNQVPCDNCALCLALEVQENSWFSPDSFQLSSDYVPLKSLESQRHSFISHKARSSRGPPSSC